jgi:hypothetical protein
VSNPYAPGDRVLILRGECAGQESTVKPMPYVTDELVLLTVTWPWADGPSETVYMPEELERVDAP